MIFLSRVFAKMSIFKGYDYIFLRQQERLTLELRVCECVVFQLFLSCHVKVIYAFVFILGIHSCMHLLTVKSARKVKF